MTRRERLERKAEKRREWAEKRDAKSEAGHARAQEILSHIPPGQPILVGHHSEKRHRGDLARIDAGMRASVEHANMAKHHRSKADGIEDALERSIYDDDPDAIEQLEARIAAREEERQRNNAINRIVRKAPRAKCTPEKIAALGALGIGEATARKLFEPDRLHGCGIPAYVNQNLGGCIKRDRDRIARIKRDRERQAAAEEAPDGIIVKPDTCGGCSVRFAEKPAREILADLKAAGYRWSRGEWYGRHEKLPASVRELCRDRIERLERE